MTTHPIFRKRAIPLLATLHGILPLLLLYAFRRLAGAAEVVAVGLFWSWPAWIVPLSRLGDRSFLNFALPLGISVVALLVAALPMLLFTVGLLGGKFHI